MLVTGTHQVRLHLPDDPSGELVREKADLVLSCTSAENSSWRRFTNGVICRRCNAKSVNLEVGEFAMR